MTPKVVFKNLEYTYKVFQKFIIDRNFEQRNNIISWPNYQPGIFKSIYVKEYQDLVSARQFSLVLFDGSFIQIFYEFEDNLLKKAKLAYYPAPNAAQIERSDIEDYYDEASGDALRSSLYILHDFLDYGFTLSNTTQIRLDYDRDVTTHYNSQMQISGIDFLRFNFYCQILPFTFVDFILKSISSPLHDIISKTRAYKYIYQVSKQSIVVDSNFINEKTLHLHTHN